MIWLNLDDCDGSEYLGPKIGRSMNCHAKDGTIFEVVVVGFDGGLPIVRGKQHGNYFAPDVSQLTHIYSEQSHTDTAPPLPVVPEPVSQPYKLPDEMSFNDAVCFIQINGMANENRETLAMRTWNACRAKILKDGNSPVTPDGWVAAVNRLLDSDGSRGCFDAMQCYDAHKEIEEMLAAAPKQQ